MRNIQKHILNFLKKEISSKEEYDQYIIFFQKQKLNEDIHELKEFFHLISKIAENHRRTPFFFDKIEQIIKIYQNEIRQNFTNYELFNYFINNKRILLFLIEQKLLIPDQSIANTLTKSKFFKKFYPHYFQPEFSQFFDKKVTQKIESFNENMNYNHDQFEKMRKLGQNDGYICQLIQNDLNDDFISFVNHSNLQLTATIEPSIFETNAFLLKNKPSLIEYAAFFGSVHIFKYLFLNDVKLTSSIWLYAIHSRNAEIIHLLEENNIGFPDNSYSKCFVESIKCHHNELSKYIDLNFQKNEDDLFSMVYKCFQYNNYKFIPDNFEKNNLTFYHLCKNDYFLLVNFFIKSSEVNLNATSILINYFFFYEGDV